jgi:hypothetical protein
MVLAVPSPGDGTVEAPPPLPHPVDATASMKQLATKKARIRVPFKTMDGMRLTRALYTYDIFNVLERCERHATRTSDRFEKLIDRRSTTTPD